MLLTTLLLSTYSFKVIRSRIDVYNSNKKTLDASEKQRPNFLDIMLQWRETEQLSQTQLREEVDTFMFAGQYLNLLSIKTVLLKATIQLVMLLLGFYGLFDSCMLRQFKWSFEGAWPHTQKFSNVSTMR